MLFDIGMHSDRHFTNPTNASDCEDLDLLKEYPALVASYFGATGLAMILALAVLLLSYCGRMVMIFSVSRGAKYRDHKSFTSIYRFL